MRTTPWVDQLALRELDLLIQEGNRPFDVFEWGSGGSTIWFGEMRIGKVISVEHDLTWFNEVERERVARGLDNVFLVPIGPTHEDKCVDSPSMPNWNFTFYVDTICNRNSTYDLIFIDGRARVKCFKVAIYYLKPNGSIVLHDSERSQYNECCDIARKLGMIQREIVEERSMLIWKK